MKDEDSDASDDHLTVPRLRHARLSREQREILENEYQKDSNWNTQRISLMARRLQLKHTKVYKWVWERKKKLV